jgi:hypothetical protein
MTHSALFRTLRGIPSGLSSNSLRTSPDAFTLASSVPLSAALANVGTKRKTATIKLPVHLMFVN